MEASVAIPDAHLFATAICKVKGSQASRHLHRVESQPWIEREKAEHIKRAVAIGKRGFERIRRLWDEREAVDPKQEQFASAALDKQDTIVRRNLGMSDNQPPSRTLNIEVLTGVQVVTPTRGQGRSVIAVKPQPTETPSQD